MDRKTLVSLKHRYIYRTIFLNVLYAYKCTNTTVVIWGKITKIRVVVKGDDICVLKFII